MMAGSKEAGKLKQEIVPRPLITFFQPRVSQVLVLFSLFGGNESALRRFLPKSHLSNVIIRDNTSVQRVQDIKLRYIEDSKRKVGNLCDQMQKKFLHDQQKKMNRWKKEYSRYQRMKEQIDERATKKRTFSRLLIESSRSSEAGRKQPVQKQVRMQPPEKTP